MKSVKTISDIILQLTEFWRQQGANFLLSYDMPMPAATFHPTCFFGALTNKPLSVIYTQPSRRNADARYGESPNRLFSHTQFQVFMKPFPTNIRTLYLESLEYIGIDTNKHEIQFIENHWANESLGASGVGHEVWCDRMEITQWTYFQRIGNVNLTVTPVELAYGIERVSLFALHNNDIFHSLWDHNLTYNDLYKQREYEFSKYFLEFNTLTSKMFHEQYEEALMALSHKLVLPAYDILLQMNNIFNSLDAKKIISHMDRKIYIDHMKHIANKCVLTYLEQQNK